MLYLIRLRGKKNKAHYWVDGDTACSMASTGGLKMDRYDVFDSPMDREICHMCTMVYDRPMRASSVIERGGY